MAQVKIELKQEEIIDAICSYINTQYGLSITRDHLNIEVKSKQNYRAEWEQAYIRVNSTVEAIAQ